MIYTSIRMANGIEKAIVLLLVVEDQAMNGMVMLQIGGLLNNKRSNWKLKAESCIPGVECRECCVL